MKHQQTQRDPVITCRVHTSTSRNHNHSVAHKAGDGTIYTEGVSRHSNTDAVRFVHTNAHSYDVSRGL